MSDGNLTKEKVEFWLFVFVAVTTLGALTASMQHMIKAFSWANVGWMSWTLAVVTVLQNGAFVALAAITTNQKIRAVVFAGMLLLFLVEFWGNFWAGGLLAQQVVPQEISSLFFGLSRDIVIATATFLFAAFLPILNFISIYALSEAALRLVERTGQPQTPNHWAELVMQMKKKSAHSASDPLPNVNTD